MKLYNVSLKDGKMLLIKAKTFEFQTICRCPYIVFSIGYFNYVAMVRLSDIDKITCESIGAEVKK